MKIVLCQLNPFTGDTVGNTQRIKEVVKKAHNDDQPPDLFIFPELFITGYPPKDLLENDWFIARGLSALDELCSLSMQFPDCGIITGLALLDTVTNGKGLFNSAVLITKGMILFHQNKSLLPSYDVFDESRYFDAAPEISLISFKQEKLGITICEDAWNVEGMWEKARYNSDPVKEIADLGATILINIAASPFHLGKGKLRYSLMQKHAQQHNLPLVFVNMTGANDELIFDGNSMYLQSSGTLAEILPAFQECIKIIDTKANYPTQKPPRFDSLNRVYDALVLGVRDYARKCGFSKAVLGLSGGIDSAVTAVIAVEALGATNVLGITMPSEYSSPESITDSQKLAKNLGIICHTISIKSMMESITCSLNPYFENDLAGTTEENFQARIRSVILMGFSNKTGSLLLTTGNKSEMAVGYCTLYGDMSGGLAVISDVYKTMVYKLARYINQQKDIIPQQIISKAPSAELKPNQKDQDTLPPYTILDPILKLLIEKNASQEQIISQGYEEETVQWVIQALTKNEYKRQQAAPGLKITQKAFGSGRRLPIAAKYIR